MIQIVNASKSFEGTLAAQNLTLQVKDGEMLGLLQANGATILMFSHGIFSNYHDIERKGYLLDGISQY